MKYNWNEEIVRNAVQESISYSEVLRRLNIPIQGNNLGTLKRKINEYNIDISHFTHDSYKDNLSITKYSPASDYIGTDKFITSSKLKLKLFKEGLKENKCEKCGTSVWQGQQLQCQLHHINGNNLDNRLENLQILCPNCHSLTDNYCGNSNEKKSNYCLDCGKEISKGAKYCKKCQAFHHRKVERPTKDVLINLYKELKSLSAIGRHFEVSDKTISKWFIYYDLPGKASELKQLFC